MRVSSLVPTVAIRVPSARPSKIWWKRMTTNNVMKKLSPATTKVRPITGNVRLGVEAKRGETYAVSERVYLLP